MSDADDDDVVSRSQHKLAMAKWMANNSIVANSTLDSEGEVENDPFNNLLYGFLESTDRFHCAEHNST